MRRPRAAMLGVLLSVVIGVAACGGGSGSSGNDFVADANRICEQRQSDLDALADPVTVADYATLAVDVRTINEEALAELRELDAPGDDADRAEEMWDLIEVQNVDLGQVESAATMGEEDAVADILAGMEERAAEFDDRARDIGLTSCITPGGQAGANQSSASDPVDEPTAMDPAEEQALLEEGFVAVQEYLDAYWSVEADREYEASASWARSLAVMHQVEAKNVSAVKDTPAQGEIVADLTGVVADGEGWTLEGEVILTIDGVEYVYDSIHLVRDAEGELVVADYCRTGELNAGPIEGCLSNGLGRMTGKATSTDGIVSVLSGPFLRTQGGGPQSVMFTLVVQNDGPTALRPVATDDLSYVLDNGDRAQVGTDALAEMDVAPPGEQAMGFITFASPESALEGAPLEAGTLSVVFDDEEGNRYIFEFEVPSLPQGLVDG